MIIINITKQILEENNQSMLIRVIRVIGNDVELLQYILLASLLVIFLFLVTYKLGIK